MYICLCKAVTESQLENAICKGANTRKDLQQSCPGVGSVCGKCHSNLQALLNDKVLLQQTIKAA